MIENIKRKQKFVSIVIKELNTSKAVDKTVTFGIVTLAVIWNTIAIN